MTIPCYTCKGDGRTCHIDLRYRACFECRCRNIDCCYGTEPGVVRRLEGKHYRAVRQTQDARDEQRKLWNSLPEDYATRLNNTIPTMTEGEATDAARHAPDRFSDMFAQADKITDSETFKAVEQFVKAGRRFRRMQLQEKLAYRRYIQVATVEDDVSDELEKVADEMVEVLGVEGFKKWRMSDNLTEYWDPSVKRLVSVSSESI